MHSETDFFQSEPSPRLARLATRFSERKKWPGSGTAFGCCPVRLAQPVAGRRRDRSEEGIVFPRMSTCAASSRKLLARRRSLEALVDRLKPGPLGDRPLPLG